MQCAVIVHYNEGAYGELINVTQSGCGHCSLVNLTMFTHKVNIVHSQTEHCALTN